MHDRDAQIDQPAPAEHRRYIINGKFLLAGPTGVHRVAAEMVNALADLVAEGHPATRGRDFTLFYPHDAEARATALRMKAHRLPFLTGIPWEQITLPLASRGATLLNFCNIGPGFARNALTMVHDVQVHLSPASYSRPFRLWYHFIQPRFARRNAVMLTVSDYSKAQIAAVGLKPADAIETIHNGVDHVLVDPADASVVARFGLAGKPYAVALASTQAHKNIAVLLKAFADPALADIMLVLFGSTTAADFAASGLAVPSNVSFSGRISDSELRGLLEGAVALLFPSTTEGFGLPPLEAMLLGCPAIVAPCGALPEVCGEAALYADPHDPGHWVAKLQSLRADHEERSRRVSVGKQWAARFTWRQSALRLLAVLDSIEQSPDMTQSC